MPTTTTIVIADDENTSVADNQETFENAEADYDNAVDVKPDYVWEDDDALGFGYDEFARWYCRISRGPRAHGICMKKLEHDFDNAVTEKFAYTTDVERLPDVFE